MSSVIQIQIPRDDSNYTKTGK